MILYLFNAKTSGIENIIPIQMDVTKINEIEEAAEIIRLWINSAPMAGHRVLHALVNNAGIGSVELVDWMQSLSTNSQKVMDVNFFGMVNTIKVHLPILKSQALSGVYKTSRIINVVSVAGLVGSVPALSMYHASKFAAEAFSMSLRSELVPFGIPVVTVNPSFHKTPLVEPIGSELDKVWKGLSPELKAEYGQGTKVIFDHLSFIFIYSRPDVFSFALKIILMFYEDILCRYQPKGCGKARSWSTSCCGVWNFLYLRVSVLSGVTLNLDYFWSECYLFGSIIMYKTYILVFALLN